jgi:hypothetical protein
MRKIFVLAIYLLVLVLASFGCKTGPVYDNDMGADAIVGQGAWLKGDLHSHSLHSDGDSPAADVVELAESKGLDFFALTDHWTTEQWSDPGYVSDKLTLLYGFEWSNNGHANIWSNKPFSIDEISAAGNDVAAVIQTVHGQESSDQTILFSINHPKNDIFCKSCTWNHSFDESREADAIEVWNARWLLPTTNFLSTRETYDSYLVNGKKISMVGGSDSHTHQPNNIQTLYNDLGIPTTWVFSPTNNGKEILDSIRAGHTFLSASPNGPRVIFKADVDYDSTNPTDVDYDVMMGDSIPESAIGKDVFFRINVYGASIPSSILVIKNGKPVILGKDKKLVVIEDAKLSDKNIKWAISLSKDYGLSFIDKPQKGDYYRVEVRQAKTWNTDAPLGELLAGYMGALSSPIYTW